ncbi:DUF6113 family protein [Microtetraspora sp. NBRC 13810]|uniref:DUF6113 family protein n=1 Tax=Microtetraspora sp. NBRC 13810 TaxID=3030990 RepID=UPI002552EED4|nr:DUF6113 family protein [Microtetraspora sp. NBRC 13810]
MGETVADLDTTPAPGRGRTGPVLTGLAYVVLAVLGVVMAVVGGFQHALYLGAVPLAAAGWVLLLFAVVYGMARMTAGKLGALVPGVAWMLVSMVLSGERGEGDLVIAANLAGYIYLYGGFAVIVLAVLLAPSHGTSWLLREHGITRSR